MDDELTGREAHFQTNLLVPTRKRTFRVGFLSHFVPEPRVPYINLLIGMGLLATVTIIFVYVITRPLALIYYLPALLAFYVGSIGLIALYILPYRGRSMLFVVISLLFSRTEERLRLSTSVNGEFTDVGISDVSEGGLITFMSGDVGLIYRVEGQISRSALPEVVDEVNESRRGYLTSRSPSTSEEQISTIGRRDATRNMDYYREVWDMNKARETAAQTYAAAWSAAQFNYVHGAIHNRDVVINQYQIIRDATKSDLRKSKRTFEEEVRNSAMYAAASLLDSRDAVLEVLGPIAMNSKEESL